MPYPPHLFKKFKISEIVFHCPLFFKDKNIFYRPGMLVQNANGEPLIIKARLHPWITAKLSEYNFLQFVNLKPTIQYSNYSQKMQVALDNYDCWESLQYDEEYVIKDRHDSVRVVFKSPLPTFDAFIDLACVDIVILLNIIGLVTLDSCQNDSLMMRIGIVKEKSNSYILRWFRLYYSAYIKEDYYLIFFSFIPEMSEPIIKKLIRYWDHNKFYINQFYQER